VSVEPGPRRTADEIVRLRRLRKLREPWWEHRNRVTAYCPRCAKRYLRAKPGWTLCLECTINPRWTTVTEAEFVSKAKRVFPGAHEPPRLVDDNGPPEPPVDDQLSFGEAA
jgi:hypothetical protein